MDVLLLILIAVLMLFILLYFINKIFFKNNIRKQNKIKFEGKGYGNAENSSCLEIYIGVIKESTKPTFIIKIGYKSFSDNFNIDGDAQIIGEKETMIEFDSHLPNMYNLLKLVSYEEGSNSITWYHICLLYDNQHVDLNDTINMNLTNYFNCSVTQIMEIVGHLTTIEYLAPISDALILMSDTKFDTIADLVKNSGKTFLETCKELSAPNQQRNQKQQKSYLNGKDIYNEGKIKKGFLTNNEFYVFSLNSLFADPNGQIDPILYTIKTILSNVCNNISNGMNNIISGNFKFIKSNAKDVMNIIGDFKLKNVKDIIEEQRTDFEKRCVPLVKSKLETIQDYNFNNFILVTNPIPLRFVNNEPTEKQLYNFTVFKPKNENIRNLNFIQAFVNNIILPDSTDNLNENEATIKYDEKIIPKQSIQEPILYTPPSDEIEIKVNYMGLHYLDVINMFNSDQDLQFLNGVFANDGEIINPKDTMDETILKAVRKILLSIPLFALNDEEFIEILKTNMIRLLKSNSYTSQQYVRNRIFAIIFDICKILSINNIDILNDFLQRLIKSKQPQEWETIKLCYAFIMLSKDVNIDILPISDDSNEQLVLDIIPLIGNNYAFDITDGEQRINYIFGIFVNVFGSWIEGGRMDIILNNIEIFINTMMTKFIIADDGDEDTIIRFITYFITYFIENGLDVNIIKEQVFKSLLNTLSDGTFGTVGRIAVWFLNIPEIYENCITDDNYGPLLLSALGNYFKYLDIIAEINEPANNILLLNIIANMEDRSVANMILSIIFDTDVNGLCKTFKAFLKRLNSNAEYADGVLRIINLHNFEEYDDENLLTLIYMLFTSVFSNDDRELILNTNTRLIMLGLGYEIYTNQEFDIINKYINLDILTFIVYSFVNHYGTRIEELDVSSIFSYIITINLSSEEDSLNSCKIYINSFTNVGFQLLQSLLSNDISELFEPIAHLTEMVYGN